MHHSLVSTTRRFFFTLVAALLALFPHQFAQAQATAVAPEQAESKTPTAAKLETLLQKLEAARIEHHVPGLGVAIVQDGEIILCTGLGEANVENNTKVTGDTIFAIGSCTKAFTATLIGTLIDENKMDWDATVSTYLPNFHMKDPIADEQVTIRDLLCHRTGLARMDLLWAAGGLTREEILAACAIAEPMHGFRRKFEYSNSNFIAAGEAAAAAGGASWEELIQRNLLNPLLMTHTTVSLKDAQKDSNLATGYQWDDINEKYKVEKMRDIVSAAPAGSINSSPRDMANWVLMQLAGGEFNGSQIIAAETLEETRSPQITIAPSVQYGLGWMLSDRNGHRMVEHGGNIDGFAASVGFFPDENLGFVLLTNVSFTKLQFLGSGIVADVMLSDDESPASTEKLDYTPYLGKYVADFGPFHDARMTVKVSNDHLAVDVPGQTLYELKDPNDEGKWVFQLTDAIAVSFDRDDSGAVNVMKMYQAGLTFELPREGYVPPVEITMEEARPYLGKYRFEELKAEAEVLRRNGRLAIDVPGEMVYELHQPNDEGRWVFRAFDGFSIEFNRNDEDAVESLTLRNPNNTFTLNRTADAEPAETITLDDVIALHRKAVGGDRLADIKTLRMEGTINFVNQGIAGSLEILAKGLSHYHNHVDLGRSGVIDVIVAGDQGWSASSFDQTEVLEGKYLESAKRQHPLMMLADWRDVADSVELRDSKTIDGRLHHIVFVKIDDIISSEAAVDAETGLITSEDITVAVRNLGSIPMTMRYDDYKDVEGVKLPTTMTLETSFHGKAVMKFDTIELNSALPDDAFAPPADAKTASAS